MAEDPVTKVNLGAKEYQLRYTIKDGRELTQRLKKRGAQILTALLGSEEDGRFSLNFDLDVLIVALQVGLRQEKRVTEDVIEKWLQEHMDNDKPIGDLIGPTFNALNASGCFGFRLKADEPEADEGKEKAPTPTT